MTSRAEGHHSVELFIIYDRIGAALGLAVVIIFNALVLRSWGVWLIAVSLAGLIFGLTVSRRTLDAGQLGRSLGIIAGCNSAVALVVPFVLPFLWPVMVLTVLMGLVLATPFLSKTWMPPAMLAGALMVATVGTVGLLNDDGGAISDIDDAFELTIVVGALVAHLIPIGLIIWQHNQLQHQNVDRLRGLNRDLLRSEGELESSRNRVVQAGDVERRRIERDLHDGAQQRLVALGVRLRLLESQGHEDPAVRDGINTLIGELDGAIEEVRELAHGIYPPLLQTRGLTPALAAVARRSPLQIETSLDDISRLDESCETALYFTALEALTNAAKYAPDATVELSLSDNADNVSLTLSDNGPGFDLAGTTQSHGMLNMSDRLAVAGGTITIDSTPGTGTTVHATAPKDSSPPT